MKKKNIIKNATCLNGYSCKICPIKYLKDCNECKEFITELLENDDEYLDYCMALEEEEG